ncbi:DNA mismatch repair protein msh3, partial [Globisporangium splendens]
MRTSRTIPFCTVNDNMQQNAGRTSTYFAPHDATANAYATIGNVRARKRTRSQHNASGRDDAAAATERSKNDATQLQLTEMEKQVVAIRAQHPDMLLLFECEYRMRMFAEDAEVFRSVVDVYTRATIPLPEPADHDEDAGDMEVEPELEPPTRFILSLVEETKHHTTFFKHKLHEVSDSTSPASKQADEVTIGIFAHDVHIGESIYEEFYDDATRKHLRELLDLVRPIELVLPMGKLSTHTEQLLHSYANQRGARDEIAEDQNHRQQHPQTKHLRIERLENVHFDWNNAKTRFATFFDAAEYEYNNFSARPTLPMLSTCCFGGMWEYLRALQLEKTLVSTKYTRALTGSIQSAQRFKLPSESLHDLDIFRNATTGRVNGSLFSILNYTKTELGVRRLQEWMSSPLMLVSEIEERQDTIQHIVFTSCDPMPATTSYHLVYEELVTNMLPESRPLLRSVQRIHTRKVTPAQLVKGLEVLIAVERCIEHTIEICSIARMEHLQLGSKQEPQLLLRLLHSFPKMNTLTSQCLNEICREEAVANNTEGVILQRLQTDPELFAQYRRLQDDLRALENEFSSVLEIARQILQEPSLEFSVFRSGSAKITSHLICVSRDKLHLVPSDWLVVNSTKKLVRFHPKAVYQLHMRQEYLQQMKKQLVESAWLDFVAQVDAQIYVLASDCVDKLASLDAICSLATLARMQPNYTRPKFVSATQGYGGGAQPKQVLEIIDGRNPIIETNLSRASYITNSISMPSQASTSPGALLAVSGPNMGGKSSCLRMCALIVLMAQIGSFVPATSVLLSIFDGIYSRMHRSTALSQRREHASLSINMTSPRQQEMMALSKISRVVASRSLVLLDEIGFGMTLQQADAFAYGLMVYLVNNVGCHVLFATHMTSLVKRLQCHLQDKCQAKKVGYNLVATASLSTQRGWQGFQRKY